LNALRADRPGKTIFVFDHCYNDFLRKVDKYAKSNKIPIVAIPHAVENWDNILINIRQLSTARETEGRTGWNLYDKIIFPDKYAAEKTIRQGVESSKIKLVGSTRFSNEWIKKLDDVVYDKYSLPEVDSRKLKIVFFLTKPVHNVFEDEVRRTIRFLTGFKDVFLIVKPHTRGMKFDQDNLGVNCIIEDRDIPSGVLTDWSDLILFTATSVVLDALKKDKPVLYLKRTVANKLIFERFIKTWEVDCRDQLRDWVWKLLDNRSTRTYTREEADLCLDELVESKVPETPDVIQAYMNVIDNCFSDKGIDE
jgi:hypothetical protein